MILYRPYHFCNLYKVLGVSKTDSTETIKEAYVKFAKEHHPDVNDGNQTNDFKEKTNAYNILKDPLKREQYDKTLQDESYHKQETKNSYYQSQQSYQSQSSYYEKRQYQHKQAEKSSQNFFIMAMASIFFISVYNYLDNTKSMSQKFIKNSTKDQPKSAQELEKLYNQSIREKEQSEIRRNNVVLSQENIQDSPFVIEQRRKEIEQEIIRKQFRIEVENYDKVQQGDRAMLRRKLNKEKTKTTKTILKTRHGDLTLEGFAKQQGVDIQKSKELDCFYFKPQSNEDNEEYM